MCHKISKPQLWLFQESIAPAGCSVSSAVRQPGRGCPRGCLTILDGTAVLQLSLWGGPYVSLMDTFTVLWLPRFECHKAAVWIYNFRVQEIYENKICLVTFSSVQFSSVWDHMDCSRPQLPVHHQLPELLKLTSIELVMPSNHLILCHPLLLLPSTFPGIRVFSNESVLHMRWPAYWTFSFSISPSKEYSGLISIRIDWLDLLTVQRTLKSLLQHHSSKASILQCSAFFIVWLSHLYMTTGKTIVLTRWTFVGKVMSLLFNILSRLVIAFLPRSKCLLISWLQSPSAVILEPSKIKSVAISIVSPSICYEVMGPDAMILVFWMLSFKPAFSPSFFTFINRLFSSLLSAIRVVSSAYLRLLVFFLAIWFQLVLHPI